MKKFRVLSIIFLLFISVVLVNILAPTSESGLLTTFSDSSPAKELKFGAGGSDNSTLNLELNKDATVISAQMSIQSSAEADTYPTDVVVDVGTDGDPDWAFKGKGYGSFGRQTTFSNGQEYRNVMFKIGGYNRDTYIKIPRNATISSATMKLKGFFGGETYVATVDYYGEVYYTIFYPDGTFGTPVKVEDISTSQGRAGTAVADFDNDGDLDFIVGEGSSGTGWKNIYYYEKIGAGATFAPKRVVGQVYASSHPYDFAVGDFNKDGNIDFMAEGYADSSGLGYLFFGDGNGMFPSGDHSFGIYYPYGKSQGDLDGDGYIDIVIGGRPQSAGNYDVWWFENSGSGDSYTSHDLGVAYPGAYGIVVGDWDLDGNQDILHTQWDANWWFTKGKGDGTFNAASATGLNSGGSYPGFGDAFDFNSDGNLDLVCYSDYGSGMLAYYLGNGDATFNPTKIAIGDVGQSAMGVAAPTFSDLGHVTNPKMDIGDDGSFEWKPPGEFSTTDNINIRAPLQGLLVNPPAHIANKMVRDAYGNEFYKIPLNFTSDTSGYIGLEIDIEYSYKALINEKPGGDLAGELNEYMKKVDPNISPHLINITIPIGVTTSTAGKIKISDVNIIYNLPPEFIKPIMTKTLEEDAVIDNLVDLSKHYIDPDEPSVDLKYTIESNSESENIRVYTDGTYYLKVAPEIPHWFGRTEVVVRATDMYGEYALSNEFIIKIEPIEDDPYANAPRPIPDITIYEGGMDDSTDLDEMDYFIDPEGDSLFFEAEIDPENKYNGEEITVNINSKNVLIVKGLGDWFGNNVPVWLYCDDNSDVKTFEDGNYEHQEILVHVLPVNDAPYWDEIPEINIDEDSFEEAYKNVLNLTYYVHDIDTPLENLSFNIQYNSDENIIVRLRENNSIDLKVPENYFGPSIVGVRAIDNDTFSDTTFNIIINPINDAPTIDIESPLENTEVAGDTDIYGTAFDLEDTIQYVRIKINEFGIWEYLSGDLNNWKFKWDATSIIPGTYQIIAEVFDGELFARDELDLTVVTSLNKRPTVNILKPENGTEVVGSINIEGSAYDEDGMITLVQIQIDGEGSWFRCIGTNSWNFELFLENMTNGKHTISARAFDSEHYSELDSTVITIKNVKQEPTSDPIVPGLFSDDEGSNTIFLLLLILIIIVIIVIVTLIAARARTRRAVDKELAAIKEETDRIEPDQDETAAGAINYKKYKFATPLALPAFEATEEQK